MFGPAHELYRVEEDPGDLSGLVLVHSLTGFVDAGGAARLAVEHLLERLQHRVIATFDVDQLIDYRSRRPTMTFDRNHWAGRASIDLVLHEVLDEDGVPFLLLSGAEPDLQWERFVAAVIELVEQFGVRLTAGLSAVPMAVPHTRPVTVTAHATDPNLVSHYQPWFGTVEVPGSASALLELRLGELGHDALGFAVHVPHYLARTAYPESARGLLDHLSRSTGLALPTEALRPAAEHATAQVEEQVRGNDEIAAFVRELEERVDAATAGAGRPSLPALAADELPSADELGAELERFLAEHDDGETGTGIDT